MKPHPEQDHSTDLKLQPMSADTIYDRFEKLGFSNNAFQLRCFIEGVRWAEKYHGIREEEEWLDTYTQT